MEKRARLRVQKKKPIKRRGTKVFLKKVLDYLKSDTFMYAPLLSSLPCHAFNVFPSSPAKGFTSILHISLFLGFNYHCFVSSGGCLRYLNVSVLEFQKAEKEKRCFGKQVGKYLISDDYLYDPLLHLPHSSKEPLHDYGMKRMDDSTRRLTMKVNQQTDHLGNANQSSESPVPQTDISDQHKHTETVKHTVYQFCRSTAAPRHYRTYSRFIGLLVEDEEIYRFDHYCPTVK
ncbi:hypothetical protein V8G54_014777 [Vigna mungo]|uniref:Uncharacterized protein n=1 Tax=Vigna mungo TaxID=3915 RepID=A0AAQ3RXS5_VIGMU